MSKINVYLHFTWFQYTCISGVVDILIFIVSCEAGQYGDENVGCKYCRIGTYNDNGIGLCEQCPDGFTTLRNGSSSVTDCTSK